MISQGFNHEIGPYQGGKHFRPKGLGNRDQGDWETWPLTWGERSEKHRETLPRGVGGQAPLRRRGLAPPGPARETVGSKTAGGGVTTDKLDFLLAIVICAFIVWLLLIILMLRTASYKDSLKPNKRLMKELDNHRGNDDAANPDT